MERRDEPPARCLGLGWPRGSPVTPQPSDAGLVRRPRLCVPRGRQVAPHRAPIAVPSSLRRRERLASRRGRSCPLLQARAQRLSISDFPGWTDDRYTPNSLRGVTPGSGRGDRRAFVLTSHGRETDHDADARRVRRAGVRMARGASRPQTCRSRVCQARRGGVGGGGHCHRVRPGSLAGRGQSGAPPLASCRTRPLVTSPPLPVL